MTFVHTGFSVCWIALYFVLFFQKRVFMMSADIFGSFCCYGLALTEVVLSMFLIVLLESDEGWRRGCPKSYRS